MRLSEPYREGELEELVGLLCEWDTSHTAHEALVKIGEPAVKPLIQLFSSGPAESVSKTIADVLRGIGKPAVEPLCKILLDYFPTPGYGWTVNEILAEVLGDIGDSRAVEPLIDALCQSDNEREEEAIEEALVNIGKPAVESIIKALKQEDIDLRWGLAKVLGNIGDSRAVEPLIEVLKDENEDEQVLREAAIALGKLGDARAVDPLTEVLKDEDADVREAAEEALESIRAKET